MEAEFVSCGAIIGTGIYLLMYQGEVVYVGKARDLLRRIYTHQNNWKNFRLGKRTLQGMKVIRFDEVRVRHCHESDLDRIEIETIRRYAPKHNKVHQPMPLPKLTMITVRGIKIPIVRGSIERRA